MPKGPHETEVVGPKGTRPEVVTCSKRPCRALVLGNANYTQGALPATVLEDAGRVAATLERLGFAVRWLLDGTQQAMKAAAEDFCRGVQPGGVGLVYFAGLSVQAGGANYLLPVDRTGQHKAPSS